MPSSVTFLVGNPLTENNFTYQHILGHIVWGLAAGLVSLKFKYFVIAGLFPIILDSDHILQIFDIEVLPRMAHSILFGAFVATIITVVFRKIDVLLIMISCSAVFTHISYDIFRMSTWGFPIFAPINNNLTLFNHHDWIIFEIIAISLVAIGTLITQRQKINNMILNKSD